MADKEQVLKTQVSYILFKSGLGKQKVAKSLFKGKHATKIGIIPESTKKKAKKVLIYVSGWRVLMADVRFFSSKIDPILTFS